MSTALTIPDKLRNALVNAGPRLAGALAWLDQHQGTDVITGGGHIQPLVKRSEAGDMFARGILSVLMMFNQHPWLWERMTFHALADIQEWGARTGVLPEPVEAWQ